MAPHGYVSSRGPMPLDMALGGEDFSTANALAEVLVGSISYAATPPPPSARIFDAVRLPSVSVKDYMRRLERYCCCTEECFVVSLIQMERIFKCNPGFEVTELNVHRFMLAAVIVATKFQDDDYYSNAYYSKCGGVSTDEMITLEAAFMELLKWRGHVSADDYEEGLERLRFSKIHLRQAREAPVEALLQVTKAAHVPVDAPREIQAPAVAPLVVPVVAPPVAPKVCEVEVAGTDVTPMQRAADIAVDVALARKTAALIIGNPGTTPSAWNSQRRARRRSATPVTHLNVRRTRVCLVVH